MQDRRQTGRCQSARGIVVTVVMAWVVYSGVSSFGQTNNVVTIELPISGSADEWSFHEDIALKKWHLKVNVVEWVAGKRTTQLIGSRQSPLCHKQWTNCTVLVQCHNRPVEGQVEVQWMTEEPLCGEGQRRVGYLPAGSYVANGVLKAGSGFVVLTNWWQPVEIQPRFIIIEDTTRMMKLYKASTDYLAFVADKWNKRDTARPWEDFVQQMRQMGLKADRQCVLRNGPCPLSIEIGTTHAVFRDVFSPSSSYNSPEPVGFGPWSMMSPNCPVCGKHVGLIDDAGNRIVDSDVRQEAQGQPLE